MMHHTEMMGISEVRGIVKWVVREERTPLDVVQAARDTVQTMCQEAAEYGLTTADVLEAGEQILGVLILIGTTDSQKGAFWSRFRWR